MTTQIELKLEVQAPKPNASILQPSINRAPFRIQRQYPAGNIKQIIEKIIDKKTENNNKFYLIKWKSAIDSEPIWEPIEKLVKCMDAVIDYEVQRRLQTPDLFYEKTSTSIGDSVSNEKRKAEWDLMDKVVVMKQVKKENNKEISPRYFFNKRCKLVRNLGLINETQWEDKKALDEISKKVKISKPFTINPIKFRFRDIMRIETGSEYKNQYTPQKMKTQVRRFETETASGSKPTKRRGRPRKIKLEHEDILQTVDSEDDTETRSERLRGLIVEIEDDDSEEEDQDEELEYEEEEEEEEENEETEEEYIESEEKEDDNEVSSMFVTAEYQKTKKPRGRPRKYVQSSDDQAPRRRPGRPRKILTEEEQAQWEKEKQSKRPRGRPRRVKLEEGQASNPIEIGTEEKRDLNGECEDHGGEELVEEEKPKPKRPVGRPRRLRLEEGQANNPIKLDSEEKRDVDDQGGDENKENKTSETEKPDKEISMALLQLLNEQESPPLHMVANGSTRRKKGHPRRIIKVISDNEQQHRKSGSEEDEVGSLEEFENIISQFRQQNDEEDNRYEEPRRKRGKPRDSLLGLGKQEAQENMNVVAPPTKEVKRDERDKLQKVVQDLRDKAFGNNNQTQNTLVDATVTSHGLMLVDKTQEKEDVIVLEGINEAKQMEANQKEKVIFEVGSAGKETMESKLKEGKASAVSILDQMQEDLMNLESPVDEGVFDDDN